MDAVPASNDSFVRLGLRRAPLRIAIARALAVGAAGVLAHQPAQAQLEEVVVTGTRIIQPDFVFSNPVTSVEAEAILNSGETNLTSFLTEVPALMGSMDSFDTAGSNAFVGGAGINMLDLRYLGTSRTLVLVDGRRHVGSLAETASVDISSIPIDLVERVDILTGGASAVYGADGVTGVVNFILKDDFEGLSIRAQGNEPSDPNASKRFLGVTYGHNFGEGGNFAVALERSSEQLLYGYDRDYNGSRPGIFTRFARNPADTADPPVGDGATDDPSVPDRIPLELTGFGDTSRCGAVYTEFANGSSPDFNCDGSPWDFGALPPQMVGGNPDFPVLPFYQVGGDATLQDDYLGLTTILPDIDRTAVNAFLTYEFNDGLEFFSEFKYVKSEVFNVGQPSFDFFLVIEPDNPFVPAALQGVPLADGVYYMSRDHVDLGLRGDDVERETERTVIGARGELDWASWETSLVYGKTEVLALQTNNRFDDRFFAALDVVDNGGVPDCRVNVDPDATPFDFPDPVTYTPGDGTCVPLNLFGEGVASQEAVDWIMGTTRAVDEIEQTVLSGFLTGDTEGWFSLPAGPMGWAAGGEYREESSESIPDPFDTAGATFGNAILPNFGEFDVTELFGEVSVPLLAGQPAAEELTLEAAYRWSDYSSIGNAATWKLGALWTPIDDVTFRATVAQAVRAPNIGEVYGAENQTFEFITDPCDVGEVPTGTQTRAANCAEILGAFGIDPNSFVDPNSASIDGVSSGNANLSEETADTTTLGVVFRPRFAENLTLAIDYYDIELEDAVLTIDPQEIAERCVDAPTTTNDFCPLIERDPVTGAINFFSLVPVNIAALETAGYDLTLNYTLTPGSGSGRDLGLFNFRLIGNKLAKLDFLPSPGGVVDDDLGEGPSTSFAVQPVPEWQATFDLTWSRGPFSINYGLQWFDKTQRISNRNLNGDSDLVGGDPDFIPSEWYYIDAKLAHDIHARFDMDNGVSVYGGITNFTDEKPAIDQTFHPVSPVGRTLYLGLTAQFADL
jgi:outer membrane receptor protein involved in Fe transport